MPGWAWAVIAGWVLVSIPVALVVGPRFRRNQQQYPPASAAPEHQEGDARDSEHRIDRRR